MANATEQSKDLINSFANLQRIKTAPDRDAEIDYQLLVVKAQLEAMGIPTEQLEIHRD